MGGLVTILFAAAVLPLFLGEDQQDRLLPLVRLAVLLWMIRCAASVFAGS
ncbi:hypothetical protein SAMN05428946_1438 [Edaphobacillus lindanitolerans]|uniref:Uncharacterized protein n=2 Tax=Edaphobacillus lindanitolerans TaxID=550447 RepID=A0A1U7PJI6_9BACI|nr:hypothetical protein SAMN05428946_1438 [Edaphobacillus lindanitolerans]